MFITRIRNSNNINHTLISYVDIIQCYTFENISG